MPKVELTPKEHLPLTEEELAELNLRVVNDSVLLPPSQQETAERNRVVDNVVIAVQHVLSFPSALKILRQVGACGDMKPEDLKLILNETGLFTMAKDMCLSGLPRLFQNVVLFVARRVVAGVFSSPDSPEARTFAFDRSFVKGAVQYDCRVKKAFEINVPRRMAWDPIALGDLLYVVNAVNCSIEYKTYLHVLKLRPRPKTLMSENMWEDRLYRCVRNLEVRLYNNLGYHSGPPSWILISRMDLAHLEMNSVGFDKLNEKYKMNYSFGGWTILK